LPQNFTVLRQGFTILPQNFTVLHQGFTILPQNFTVLQTHFGSKRTFFGFKDVKKSQSVD